MNNYSILKPWATTLPSIFFYVLLLFFGIGVHAQTSTIKGTITDANGTLLGVTIKVKEKPTATLSDENGTYAIEVSPTDILVFSFIGYKTAEIPVANRSTINLKLEEDSTLFSKRQRTYRKYCQSKFQRH